MTHEGSEILFPFFFQPDYLIRRGAAEADIRQAISAWMETAPDQRLVVFSTESTGFDFRAAISAALTVEADLLLPVQAVSISDLRLAVQRSVTDDGQLRLVLAAPAVAGDHQALWRIRQEDRFTN